MKDTVSKISIIILIFLMIIVSCREEKDYIPRVVTLKDYERFYEIPPVPDSCKSGVLNKTITEKIADTINYYRDSLGVGLISYFESANDKLQQAVLMMLKNGFHGCDSTLYTNCFSSWGMECLCDNCNNDNGISVFRLMHFYDEIDLNTYDRVSEMFIPTTIFVDDIDLSLNPQKLFQKYPFLAPEVQYVTVGRIEGKAILDVNTDNPNYLFCTIIKLVCFYVDD